MPIVTDYNSGGGKGFHLPTGTLHAVCCGVYDLGFKKTEYMGKQKEGYHTVLMFELVGHERDDGTPITVSKWYNSRNFSSEPQYKPALQKDVERWFGKAFPEEVLKNGFDLEKLYGKNCLLSIVKNDKNGKEKIESINPIMSNIQKVEPQQRFEHVPDFIERNRSQEHPTAEHEDSTYDEGYSNEDEILF